MSPLLDSNTQKLDAVVDGKLPDDLDSASIFSKIIGQIISDGSRYDLYSRFRMKFTVNIFQTQAQHFMDLGLLAINKLNESVVFGTTATSI